MGKAHEIYPLRDLKINPGTCAKEPTVHTPGPFVVLILDDDPKVLQSVGRIVQRLGHRSILTQTAEEFFTEAEANHIDFMIIDLLMPGSDGLDILRKLAPECESTVIITSGSGARVLDSVRQSALSYGLNVGGQLCKPFRISELRALLARPAKPRPPTVFTLSGTVRTKLPSEADLRLAFDRDEIVAYFQPKVCSKTGAPRGFEALARWLHPRLGTILPAHFLPMVTRSGLDHELFFKMVGQACSFVEQLQDSTLHVALNLTPLLCRDPKLPEALLQQLAPHNVCAENLFLEVTEIGTQEMEQAEVETLTHLRLSGFRLSIDDFGTGQSTLRRLLRIPFDEVKIDTSFVAQVPHSRSTRGVVRAITRLAEALRMVVTAEGVEDLDTVEILERLGCDMIQGYGVLRPVSLEAALIWLRKQRTLSA